MSRPETPEVPLENALNEILKKLEIMGNEIKQHREAISILDKENQERAKAQGAIPIDTDASGSRNMKPRQMLKPSAPSENDKFKDIEDSEMSDNEIRESPHTNRPKLQEANKVIKIIKPLKGKDDQGVEDFIKSIKNAKQYCNDPDFLLQLILAEKLQHNAERTLRYIDINSYEQLYAALRENLNTTYTPSVNKKLLGEVKQGISETVKSCNIRFRKALNDLKYSIQAKQKQSIKRKILLEDAEELALELYIENIKLDIALQIRAQGPKSMIEAQQIAIETEMWLKKRTTFKTFNKPITKTIIDNKPKFQENKSPPQKVTECYKCKKPGHMANNCPESKNFRFIQSTQKPPPRINLMEEEIESEKEEEQEAIQKIEYQQLQECSTPSTSKEMEEEIQTYDY